MTGLCMGVQSSGEFVTALFSSPIHFERATANEETNTQSTNGVIASLCQSVKGQTIVFVGWHCCCTPAKKKRE